MNQIPEEIDSLMWTLAEKQDMVASEEFLKRLPMYRAELMKRMDAMSALKRSVPVATVTVPSFRMMPVKTAVPVAVPVTLGLLVASLGGGYLAYKHFGSNPTPPGELQELHMRSIAKRKQDVDGLVPNPPVDVIGEPTPMAVKGSGAVRPNPGQAGTNKLTPGMTAKVKKLKLDNQPLQTVLVLLAQDTGLKIENGEGLPNPVVNVDYANQSALSIFQDLGRKYGFVAVEDVPGTITLMPIDPSSVHDERGDEPGPTKEIHLASCRIAMPGRTLPSRYSRLAPPPVLT